MKRCSKCGVEKALEDFARNGAGLRGDCKICCAAYVRAKYHANLEEARRRNRESGRRRYAQDPEGIRAKIYASRDPEKHIAANVRWAQANPDKANGYKRTWAKANPESCRDRVRKRRALRENAFVAEVRFDEILVRDLGVCGICERPIVDSFIEIDHIVPLAAGGTHEPDNVQLAHRTCNRRKHARVNFSLAAPD